MHSERKKKVFKKKKKFPTYPFVQAVTENTHFLFGLTYFAPLCTSVVAHTR